MNYFGIYHIDLSSKYIFRDVCSFVEVLNWSKEKFTPVKIIKNESKVGSKYFIGIDFCIENTIIVTNNISIVNFFKN